MKFNIREFAQHLVEDELSYNLTRPYPREKLGKWFKLWVFLASIVVLAGLTVVNLATSGFDKQVTYTSEPNKTAAQQYWYTNKIFTWGDDTLEPKCENVEIPIGHQFLTTNLGLRYEVHKITGKDGKPQASVSYHNNNLTNCEISNIGISLTNSATAKPSKEYRREPWIRSTADAIARCNISTKEGPFMLDFKTEYKTYIESIEYIAVADAMNNATFWWGARLMNAYFVALQYVMSGPLPDDNDNTPIFTTARLSYEMQPDSKGKSIKDPLLFKTWLYFLNGNTGIRETMEKSGLTTDMLYNNASYSKSRPVTEGLFFAKVFRSLILADLGNSETENLLLSPDLLQYALNPGEDDFNRIDGAPLMHNTSNKDWWTFSGIATPGVWPSEKTAVPFHEAYDKLKDKTGKLETKTATINSVYTCTVPEKKSKTTMFLVVLVADLALFQTAWGLFKHILDQRTTWKDDRSNYCEGCVNGYGFVETHDGERTPSMFLKSPSIGANSSQALLVGEDDHPHDQAEK